MLGYCIKIIYFSTVLYIQYSIYNIKLARGFVFCNSPQAEHEKQRRTVRLAQPVANVCWTRSRGRFTHIAFDVDISCLATAENTHASGHSPPPIGTTVHTVLYIQYSHWRYVRQVKLYSTRMCLSSVFVAPELEDVIPKRTWFWKQVPVAESSSSGLRLKPLLWNEDVDVLKLVLYNRWQICEYYTAMPTLLKPEQKAVTRQTMQLRSRPP